MTPERLRAVYERMAMVNIALGETLWEVSPVAEFSVLKSGLEEAMKWTGSVVDELREAVLAHEDELITRGEGNGSKRKRDRLGHA